MSTNNHSSLQALPKVTSVACNLHPEIKAIKTADMHEGIHKVPLCQSCWASWVRCCNYTSKTEERYASNYANSIN